MSNIDFKLIYMYIWRSIKQNIGRGEKLLNMRNDLYKFY